MSQHSLPTMMSVTLGENKCPLSANNERKAQGLRVVLLFTLMHTARKPLKLQKVQTPLKLIRISFVMFCSSFGSWVDSAHNQFS